jgi:hypothetical protein
MVTSHSPHRIESPTPDHRRGRWTVNITPAERAARVVVGGFGAIVGVVLLLSAGSLWAVLGILLLIAAGLDLVVTGAVGHCPLYAKLGYTPVTLKGPR